MSESSPAPEPAVTLEFRENGPVVITGPATVKDASGERVEHKLFLCRCGASTTKPLCDGTHKAVGFVAAGVSVARKPSAS